VWKTGILIFKVKLQGSELRFLRSKLCCLNTPNIVSRTRLLTSPSESESPADLEAEAANAIFGPLRTSKEFQETLLSLPAWQEPLQGGGSKRDRLAQAEFRFSVEFNDDNPEITSIIATRSQISFDEASTYMSLVLMIKREVERADEYQYNYHKRTIFANQESVSVTYNCSLSLEAEDRHKILKTEDRVACRLTSMS